MKKAVSLFLAASLSLVGLPVGAEGLPDSISGRVPGGLEGVANAILIDGSGKTLSMVPVSEGQFAFRNVAPGEYTVGLYSTSGQRVASSCALSLAKGDARETSFDCPAPAAAPDEAAAATTPNATMPTTTTATAAASTGAVTGGGISTTGWILIGAAAVGITTAVVIATNDDEGVASATR